MVIPEAPFAGGICFSLLADAALGCTDTRKY
jgi:hypothetical protein